MRYMAPMKSDRIFSALEDASALVARLDARISVTPMVEAWQVRATFLAAENLAAVDGTPTRSGDILGLMMSSPLPSPDAYRPATIGFGHWRRCMARMEFSEIAERLLGRSISSAQAAEEAQSDWDMEDDLSPAVRRALSRQAGQEETVDSYALEVSERALDQLRSFDTTGSVYHSLAKGLQQAIRRDPDPSYFERVHKIRQRFEADVRSRFNAKKTLPSPDDRDPADEFLSAVNWDRKPHLGACFSVVPDRLQEMGVTANRLSCLTGATKRLGFEGRLDDRAFLGFLNQLSQDARAGLALLDALEAQMGEFGRSSATKFDQRSPLPRILYGFLLLPVVDAPWLQKALDLQESVTQKHFKRLADEGIISHWGDRPVLGPGRAGRPVTLWSAARVMDDFEKTARSRSTRAKSGPNPLPSPAEMLLRYRDIDVSIPMAVVYDRHQDELADLDKVYGHFFDRNWVKNRSSRKPIQSENAPSTNMETSGDSEALSGA